jgi:hypothetical protein
VEIIEMIWAWANQPAGIAIVAGVVLYLLNMLYKRKPKWSKYEGVIISAIRMAEKAIPDNHPNKIALRTDTALQYVLKVYQARAKKLASDKVTVEISDEIRVMHNKLSIAGALNGVTVPEKSPALDAPAPAAAPVPDAPAAAAPITEPELVEPDKEE